MRIVVLAKAPVAGLSKTRLQARWSAQQAADLAESFPYISLDKTGRYLFGASYGGHLISVNAVGADANNKNTAGTDCDTLFKLNKFTQEEVKNTNTNSGASSKQEQRFLNQANRSSKVCWKEFGRF